MNSKRASACIPAVIALCLVASGFMPPLSAEEIPAAQLKGPSAEDVLTEGLSKAKKESKRVFLVFGFPECGWCRRLEEYHHDASVAAILTKYYVIVKVDTENTPGGAAMCGVYGKAGAPSWAILDDARKVVIDSDDGTEHGNVGYPGNALEWAHYEKAMKAGSPTMPAEEIAALVEKLKEHHHGAAKPEAKAE